MNVQDWCTAHLHIFYDIGDSVAAVTEAMVEATRLAASQGTLEAPIVRAQFRRMGELAAQSRGVVDKALGLPEIPDVSSQVQFHDAMDLRGRWADAVVQLAETSSIPDVELVESLAHEATRQGALIEADLRRAWPDQTEA